VLSENQQPWFPKRPFRSEIGQNANGCVLALFRILLKPLRTVQASKKKRFHAEKPTQKRSK